MQTSGCSAVSSSRVLRSSGRLPAPRPRSDPIRTRLRSPGGLHSGGNTQGRKGGADWESCLASAISGNQSGGALAPALQKHRASPGRASFSTPDCRCAQRGSVLTATVPPSQTVQVAPAGCAAPRDDAGGDRSRGRSPQAGRRH